MGNFNPVDRDEIQETKSKWWKLNLYRSGLLYGFVDSYNFTSTTEVEKTCKTDIAPFLPLCCDSEANLSKNVSSRSPGLECSHGIVLILVTAISVAKSEISVTGPARPVIRNKSKFYEKKTVESRSRKPSPGSYEEARVRVAETTMKIPPRPAWNNLFVNFSGVRFIRRILHAPNLILKARSNGHDSWW